VKRIKNIITPRVLAILGIAVLAPLAPVAVSATPLSQHQIAAALSAALPSAHAGAPGNWTFTNEQRARLYDGTYGNLTTTNAVTFKMLTSSSNIGASSTTCSGVTGEVANGNGYTTGGQTGTLVLGGTAPAANLSLSAQLTWTGSGSGFPFRYWEACAGGTPHVLAYALADATPADVTVAAGGTESLTTANPITSLG